jgi:hypothetical protein
VLPNRVSNPWYMALEASMNHYATNVVHCTLDKKLYLYIYFIFSDLIVGLGLCCLTSFGWRKFPPENSIWNTAVPLLSYSCMFQVEICSQQLEICKSVCIFIVLAIALWRLINFRLFCSDESWLPIMTSCRKDKQSWMVR